MDINNTDKAIKSATPTTPIIGNMMINNPRSIYDIDKWCKSDRSKLYEEE